MIRTALCCGDMPVTRKAGLAESSGATLADPAPLIDLAAVIVAIVAVIVALVAAFIAAKAAKSAAGIGAAATTSAGDITAAATTSAGDITAAATKSAGDITAAATTSAALVGAALQEQIAYLSGLHAERLVAYQELYSKMRPLSLDSQKEPDKTTCGKIADEITDWYFMSGGLLVDEKIRDEILDFRYRLRAYAGGRTDDLPAEAVRQEREAREKEAKEFHLRVHASTLRTRLGAAVYSKSGG